MRNEDFRRFLDNIDVLSPRQIEDARTKIQDVRSRKEAIAEIEARATEEYKCKFCGHGEKHRWGKTRTGIQRFRCKGCLKTFTGRTGSRIARVHRPDLLLEVVRDMLGSGVPSTVRALAKRLGRHKDTVWRWRIKIQAALAGASAELFAGIVEVDEAFQRESRKGSREWVRHKRNPAAWPKPPRLRWYEYGKKGIPMLRGLSRWQLPILSIADRGGARRLERIPDRSIPTIDRALTPRVAVDAVLCSDALQGYINFAQVHQIQHFIVGKSKKANATSPSHHIQNINSLHSRYKGFIRFFCGPASKYLSGYLQWFIARISNFSAVSVFQSL